MSDPLKHKLFEYEVVPPPSVWNAISTRLEKEYNPSDAAISTKFENASIPAPASVWNNITQQLNKEINKPNKPALLVSLFYKRIAVAIVLTGIVASSFIYFFTGQGSSFAHKLHSEKESYLNHTPSTSSENQFIPSPATVIPQKPQSRLLAMHAVYNKIPRKNTVHSAGLQAGPDLSYLQEAQTAVQTVSALKPVNVAAPPIRDENGNIIMDMKLISDTGNHFITVTSPNGTQTKISDKFLPCLSYLNDNLSTSQSDEKGFECSQRFREWRDKLLLQAAYVPSANNFFDIFELQQLIQD